MEKETDRYRVRLKISQVEELMLHLHEQLSWPKSPEKAGGEGGETCLASTCTPLPLPWRLLWCQGELFLGRLRFLAGFSLHRQRLGRLGIPPSVVAEGRWAPELLWQLSCRSAALKWGGVGPSPFPEQRFLEIRWTWMDEMHNFGICLKYRSFLSI